MDYDEDLQRLKRSFAGGGEGMFYFRNLDRLETRAHVEWLDVGIGRDGSSLRACADHLLAQGRRTLAITGIDPDAAPGVQEEARVRWTLLRTAFQNWTSSQTYDVVNADQSIYYLGRPEPALTRLTNALKPNGLLIATCWSSDDALFGLHNRLFPGKGADLCGEHLADLIDAAPDLERVDVAKHETTVDLGSWRDDPSLLEAAVRVVARATPIGDLVQRTRDLALALKDLPALAPRRNLAICARRRG